MKESTFIELLNLYIDHQISPADAALLEEEVLQNPQRRQIYTDYCRMHRACTMALGQYKIPSEVEGGLGRVVAFEAPRRVRWTYYAAGLAAACVALVAVQAFVRSGRPVSIPPAATGQSQAALARSDAAVLTAGHADVSGVRTLSNTENYIAQQLRLVSPMVTPANRMSLAASDHRNAVSLPLRAPTLRLIARPSIEDFVFAHQPATPDNTHIFRARQSPDDQAEMSAIEYQKQ
jgi:hypothetical protein